MKISNISGLNLYKGYQNYQKNNKPVAVSDNVISFGAVSNDKKLAGEYFKRFSVMVSLENDANPKELEKERKTFFKELKNENTNVQKEFLLMRKGEHESAFAQSLYSNYIESSRDLLNMLAKADEKTKAAFLVPDKAQIGSPFFLACDYDNTLELATTMRKMIKTLSKENQAKFYYRKSESIWGNNNTVAEELRDSGFSVFAEAIEADRNRFAKTNPDIALKFLKKYPPDSHKVQFQAFKEQAEKKTEDKKEKTSNFRVYEHVKTKFSDVGGLFNVKKQIKEELLNILNNPKVKNADKPSGIILYGPPGTGKTLLATAIAGEANVPFVSANGSSFVEIFVGTGAKHVRELYDTARELASKSESKTAIVFIDEADAVAAKRDSSNNSEGSRTLNALLGEMDGVQSKEESDIKIITILATNRKDMFDEAFRKGRIDLEFQIDDPRFSTKARREILEISAKNKPFKDEKAKSEMLDYLAKTSVGLSGAELADIIKRAYRKTLYSGREIEYITQKDITDSKLEALLGTKNDTEEDKFEMRKTIAHEAGHAINYIIMNKAFEDEKDKNKQPVRTLDLIINESRGNTAGVTVTKPSENNTRFSIESLMSDLISRYGGYSIEEKMFDGHTDGVSSDLRINTEMIINAVTKYGLGSKTKYIGCDTSGITFELFKPDIKNDLINYSNKAMELSLKISEFVAPFIEQYLDTLENTKDDKTAIITGEKFEEMFKNWLKQNGNQQEYENLLREIKTDIAEFKKSMKS